MKIKRMCGWCGRGGFFGGQRHQHHPPPTPHTQIRIVQSPQLLGKKLTACERDEERDAYTYTTNTGHKNEHRLQKTIGQNSYLCREQRLKRKKEKQNVENRQSIEKSVVGWEGSGSVNAIETNTERRWKRIMPSSVGTGCCVRVHLIWKGEK